MDVIAEDDVDPRDIPLAKEILRTLLTCYPGWAWVVEIPAGQNIVKIKNLDACPRGSYGFMCHKDKLSGGSVTLSVMRAGGHFLERYNMPRTKFKEEFVKDRPKLYFEKPDA